MLAAGVRRSRHRGPAVRRAFHERLDTPPVTGVVAVTEVRARWLGYRLRAEVNVAVDPESSVAGEHAVATEVNHRLTRHLDYLEMAVVHVDPVQEAGKEHHRVVAHGRDGLPTHSH